jgi:hypothetical protein
MNGAMSNSIINKVHLWGVERDLFVGRETFKLNCTAQNISHETRAIH